MSHLKYDICIIGGGFYGICTALYFRNRFPKFRIVIFEQESDIMQRASLRNQARVHNGYHYPRSLITAHRSRNNFPLFIANFPDAVKTEITKIYAIAKTNSKVNAVQFSRFCNEIRAPHYIASPKWKSIFNKDLIEEVFEVEEYAFDSNKIKEWAKEELRNKKIDIEYNFRVFEVAQIGDYLRLNQCQDCRFIFNTTYSGLNYIKGDLTGIAATLKHEIAEMVLIKVPPILDNVGITIMDGPFFSVMPFPSMKAHTLSHVRYTPHCSWIDDRTLDPYEKLLNFKKQTRFDRMIRDSIRYVPILENSEYIDSLFEIKTILGKNEANDGRPILLESDSRLPNFYSILGGKIDNIYDILKRFDKLNF